MIRRLSTPRLITLEPTAVVPLPIAYGGTSATSAQDALRNLHAISFSEKGAPNGVATLDENGIVPLSQLPPFSIDAVALSAPVTLEVAPAALPSTNLSVLGFELNTYTQTSVSLGFSSKSFSTSTPTLTMTQARYPLVDASTAMSTSLYC